MLIPHKAGRIINVISLNLPWIESKSHGGKKDKKVQVVLFSKNRLLHRDQISILVKWKEILANLLHKVQYYNIGLTGVYAWGYPFISKDSSLN